MPTAASTSTRRWWVIGSVGVSAMVAIAMWFGVASVSGKVTWVNTGFDVVAGDEVDVRFDVHREADRAVTCVVEAQDEDHFVVGRTSTLIPPAQASPSRHLASVKTAGLAVTGYVDSCEYVDERT